MVVILLPLESLTLNVKIQFNCVTIRNYFQ